MLKPIRIPRLQLSPFTKPQPPAAKSLQRRQQTTIMSTSPSTPLTTLLTPALYTSIHAVWFQDVDPKASTASPQALQRWFGGPQVPISSRQAFDATITARFSPVLDALGPEAWPLPPFESHDADIAAAGKIAGPLIQEVEAAAQKGKGIDAAAETLLALTLLLDQFPRNIYREPEAMGRYVYRHFDRLALTLLYASHRRQGGSPLHAPLYRHRPAFHSWLLMPLVHAEHAASHRLWYAETEAVVAGLQAAGEGDKAAELAYVRLGIEAEDKHWMLIERFGRYPHRNQALGRRSTEEEVEYLKQGETFGVKQV